MLNMLRRLAENWGNWVGDRDMELAIRSALTREGLRGTVAKFSGVRLVAVQRPGWLQIYAFDAGWDGLESGDERLPRVFGLVRQDERCNRTEVEWFESAAARNALFNEWSEGLHRLRSSP